MLQPEEIQEIMGDIEMCAIDHIDEIKDQKYHDSLLKIRDVAAKLHADVNQTYGGYPYMYHLDMVYIKMNIILLFSQRECFGDNPLNPDERDLFIYSAVCYLHDVIEDTRTSYSRLHDILVSIGVDYKDADDITETVYLMTDYKGRNRAERKPKQYWDDIVASDYAYLCKAADFLMNFTTSRDGFLIDQVSNKSMLKMYTKEWNENISQLNVNSKFLNVKHYMDSIVKDLFSIDNISDVYGLSDK